MVGNSNGTTTGESVTFNLKSTISHTAAVMAVSSSYNIGDLYIRIDNIYNLPGEMVLSGLFLDYGMNN